MVLTVQYCRQSLILPKQNVEEKKFNNTTKRYADRQQRTEVLGTVFTHQFTIVFLERMVILLGNKICHTTIEYKIK